MTFENRKTFDDNLSFTSLSTVYDSVLTCLESMTSAIEDQDFVSNNAKYLALTSDEIITILPYEYYHTVANRDGIFVVD